MKRLNIILSVVLFTCTTILTAVLPIVVKLDFGQWLVLACLIIVGYTGAYLYFDNYCDMIKADARKDVSSYYNTVWDDAYDQGYHQGWLEYKKTEGGKYTPAEHIKTFDNLNKHFKTGE